MTEPRLRVLSLGAGVQSTTLALMAAHGEIGPMLDCAIFADTQSEPSAVYEHLQWLLSVNVLPFPIHIVTIGSLYEELMKATRGESKRGSNARPPFFVKNPDGSRGIIRRQCTGDYKIDVIQKKVRELLELRPRQWWPKHTVVEQWIGISTDEATRMKHSQIPAIRHRWPLIEKDMNRRDCIRWMESRGYPRPPKSACTFCPYRSDTAWRDMRDADPAAFAQAVEVDRAVRGGLRSDSLVGELFLHDSLIPLEDVDLSTPRERGVPDLFNNECEGMCGV